MRYSIIGKNYISKVKKYLCQRHGERDYYRNDKQSKKNIEKQAFASFLSKTFKKTVWKFFQKIYTHHCF
jgi:hypothetical protein